MWNRFSGKSNNAKDNSPSQSSRRNDDEQRHPPPRSGSITSSISNKKTSSRADDRDPRGFNPTSTSYSSTTRERYPAAASASIASSYATASENKDDEPYTAPGLVRNASLADQMPRSSLSRSSRDQGEARNIRDKKRDKTERSDDRDQDVERRQRRDNRDKKDKGMTKFEHGLNEDVGTSRGPVDFPDQVSSSSFSQFPGQYDGELPGPNGAPPEHPAMSSHVQDQFPGQFPTQSSAPYRPPLAASEGGPGLAAEYYGDDGQSVAEQPGNRANTPSLIIGAEPHLQPALAVAAPPPEPSASGAVGAAASFFSGEFQEDEVASTHGQQNPSTYATGQTIPNSNYHSSSASVMPTLGGAAIGSAAGYFVDSQISHQQHPEPESPTGGPPNGYSAITTHRPPSQTHDSYHSSTSRPSKPSKQSSQSSNIPVYAIGAAGAAGLAASAYDHNHHSANHSFSSTPQYSATSMAQRHRNQGPFGALLDFFEDPEGVAQFEEYSQIIGVCKHCFAPGSSPRDAPRKHLYGRRRSNERYSSNTRVDKDSRYYSSENEGRRKNNKSWLATGLAGYGLAKVGESLFKEKNDFDDTYNVKTGGFSPNGRDRRARRRSHSIERVEIGSTGDGKSDRKEPRDNTSAGTRRTKYSTGGHSGTSSRSTERKTGLTEAAIGAALETSVGRSSSRRRSRSPKGTSVKGKHKSQKSSPERRHQIKKKKRDRGFFGFGNGSFSSSSVDVAYTGTQDKQRSSKRSNGKSKDDEKAEAALLGLGAAAAALALKDGPQGRRRKGVKELVGRKETIDNSGHDSGQAHRSRKSSENLDDELWESAAEDGYESVDFDLAYGAPVRRDSRESLSSESSGTNKWGWRWGSKKTRRVSSPRRQSPGHSSFPAVAGAAAAGLTGAVMASQDQRQSSAMDSTSSLPLQHVYPVPTSDPSRFDVGREGSIASSSRPVVPSRPEAVPLQHPRPIAPVSAAIYSSQTAYEHSYSAPAGPAVFSQSPNYRRPGAFDARHETNEASLPGSFPRSEQQADDTARDFRIRRRDSSPGRFGEDSISNSIAPRRRTSAKDEASAVRFDLTEEQEERDRRERRRKRKEDKERREVEEQEQSEKERRAFKAQSSEKSDSKTRPAEVPDRSSKISWAGPAAAGVIGAAIGAAAATDRSRSEETREERRERRRRKRELEDEEDALSKSDRRRRQRERDDQEAAIKERGRLPDEVSASREYANHEERSPEKQKMSVWQEAASTKQSSIHESYGAFFTPLELLNNSSDQVKITSANADADIDLEQVPQIVTVEPKRIHDLSDSPVFSLADSDDKIDPSKLSFPWQVPKLRLVEPTPPSSRASTPIPPPKDVGDEGFEEPVKERSSSQVKWKDDQTHEYTIITPKENRNGFFEPPSGESSGIDPEQISRSAHERDLPGPETHPHNDSGMETASAAYDEDAEFAATLAASAEDAGFDPSIVINNPTYRRRDSPPGSNERGMPGGFDDENERQLNKKERKRKEKASKRRGLNDGDGLSGRDENAIVQDMISQVEESESRSPSRVPSENFDDDWESIKNIEFKKSNKGLKDSESRDDFFETSEIASKAPNLESRDVYESPTQDSRSIAPVRNEAESSGKPDKESKPDSTGFDDAVSTVSFTTEASKDPIPKQKDKRKGSIWGRVLGKSTGSLPQESGAKDVTDEAILEDFKEPKKRSKNSKQPKSIHDENDHDSKKRSSIEGTASQISGRISQDLPAKDQGSSLPSRFSDAGSVAQYLDHGIEPEQVEQKQQKSFLGMGPEPPPPPDIRAENERLSDPLQTTTLPTSARAESETQYRLFSDSEISNPTQTTAALPSSPTAVPFHFRRPGRSSSTARSLSQKPLSSNKSEAELPPKQKTRPRSTDFKSSKEIRPSWLVERHRSHQEPTHDEIYPSLPSSHTTSRSSSVHDLEGIEDNESGDHELNKAEHEPFEVEPAPLISTDSGPIQSNLLDSQQATPTKSSFQESRTVQDLPSPQASKDLSSKVIAEETTKQPSSTLEGRVLGSVLGGSAAVALSEAIQHNYLSRQDLSREENEVLEKGSDDMIQDPVDSPSFNEILDQEDDFLPQKTKKGKKNKRKAGQLQQKIIPTSVAAAVEAKPSTISMDLAPLNSESMRQIQERDAQDAVDSWSPSVVPSNKSKKGKKGKKGKGRAVVERSPEEKGPSPNAYELPWDNLEKTVPAEGQESDTLTREMSREQIVDIMTSAAQDSIQEPFEVPAKKNESESKGKRGKKGRKSLSQDHLSRDDSPQNDLPQDNLQQDNLSRNDLQQRSLPKYESSHDELPQLESQQKTDPYGDGDFPQINFPRDDFSPSQDPQAGSLLGNSQLDSLPPLHSSAPAKVPFMDPFLKQGEGNGQDSPEANPASQEEIDREEFTAGTSPPLELSPKATPLPDIDDGHKVLDERLGTPVFTSLDQSDDKEVEAAAENFLDDPHIHDPAVIPGLQEKSRDLPSQAEQVDTDDYFASPSKQRSQEDKTAKQSFVGVEDDKTVEIREEDRPIPSVFTSTTLKDDSPRHLNDEPTMEIFQGKSETVQDGRGAFTRNKTGKKGKKSKQISSTGNSKITEIQEGQESLPNMATSEALEDHKALKLIDESTIDDVSQAKAGALEDKWAGFDSKEDVMVEKQRSGTEDLGPGPAEIEHRFERQEDARDDLNDPSTSLATTRTSQEVSTILGLEETEASIGGESKEAFPNNSRAESDLQKSPKNRMSNKDERDLPVLYELETPQFEDAPAKAHDGEMSTTLDTSVARTNAAQVVQDVLAGKDNAESTTDAKRQAMVASTVMEETATGKSIKENEGDEYAPKKKRKGKKGKQNEASSWDEPQTIELAEVSDPLGTMNTPLEQEPAADKPIEEEEMDRDAPKKKKKGKKGKQSEAFSLDEPQTVELAEVSDPLGTMNTPLEQEPAADKPIEEEEMDRDAPKKKKKGKKGKQSEAFSLDEPQTVESAADKPVEEEEEMDRDAPKKKKKGKKGKKNEVFSLVEPEIVEPAELSAYPAGMDPQLSEQEPVVEAINEVSSKQSKKDRKNKKGKRTGVSRAFSDIRDEDESNIVSTEIPQIENTAEDLPATRSDFREKIESSASLTEVPRDDNRMEDLRAIPGGSRDEVEPTILPTEILQDDGQMKDVSAIDAREEVEANLGPTEEPQDDDKVEDLPADVMPPTRAEISAPGEVSEPAVPTELAQDSEREKSRDASSEQEQDFIPPKGKKEEKECNDRSAGNKDFERDGPVQIIAASVDAVKESEKTPLKTQSEQEEDFMLPKNKEDGNTSKELNAFLQGSNVSSLLEDPPVYKTEDFEKEMPRQTFPSSVDAVKEPKTFVEGLSDEKKDREDTEEARPLERKDENIDAMSEQDTAQDLMKDVESDGTNVPLNASGDLAQMEDKCEEPTHGYFDSVLGHAAASGIPHESTSSVRSSLEQPADVSGDITAYHVNESEVNIVPAVETDTNPLYSLKPSKKDKKRAKKARSLNWEEEEILQERRAILKESSAAEGLSEPPIIPVSQESESWSKPEMSAKEVESMEIIQPGMRSTEYQVHQGSVLEGRLSQARDDANTNVEAEREESFANAKRAKTGERTKIEELSVPERERDRSLVDGKESAWVTATTPTQGNEQTSEQQPRANLNTTKRTIFDPEQSVGELRGEQTPILTEPGATEEASNEESPWDVQGAEKLENQHDGAQWHEPNIEDLSSSAAREPVREIVETVRKGESDANVEPLGTPEKNEPIPAVEVEMLDAQEQRNYNEEYAKELERQLSPLQEGERAGPSRDEADIPVFSQSSIDSVMERPYEEEHRPLARPPALEDILEESRSRSGSVQGSPVDREDGFSPSKSTKKGKKSRKGKKQQPIIWEDETAMPPMEPENDQVAKPAITFSEGPGSCDIDAARPHNLEEPLQQRSLEEKKITSPTGYSKTANDESLREKDPPSDYFAIQPSRPAEEDVGREDTHEFRRALSIESPYSTIDQSPGREPQTSQDDHPGDEAGRANDQDERLRSLATNSHNKLRTEAQPAKEQSEDDFDPASVRNTENGNESKQKPSAKPSSQAPMQEVSMDQTLGLEASARDTSNERSTSWQHSLRSPSDEEDKTLSVAEGRPTSRGRSGSMDMAAAVTGLGIGTSAAESLSRRDSVNEGTRGEKAKEGGGSTNFEAGIGELESPVDRGEMASREQEHRQTPESENAVRARQYYQATPPRSPPSANHEAITDHPLMGDLGLSSEAPKYRDSAIFVSGSPMISEGIPYHRAVRDSGYPDTEASPIVDELKNIDDPTESESNITAGEEVGYEQHRHSRAHETDERQRSTSRDRLKISVEATSDYDVSISRPGERRKRSRRRSGAAYDSDDSADSGFDIQRRRRRQAIAAEPRGPSPVSSTTKDRSSALFDSSPSAREEKVATAQDHNVSLHDEPIDEEPTWSFDREESPQQRSREASREGRLDGIPERAPESTGYDISTGNEGTGTSLFGDPRSYQGDIQSPSRSPRSSDSRGRRRLDHISENSGDESPLHKKDKRAVSDVGFPESGVKGRRMRSPGVEDDVAGDYVSTHEPISRQAWDAADEEKGAVDEGSRSRHSDQVSSVSSRHSALPGVTRRQREDEYGTYRTASAASAANAANVPSENSIYAIIRTPEQVRSASGLSYRSSGTPPLRRVDRSLSGDLRGASQKTEAKRSAKSSAKTSSEIIGIPSSSTYDPVTDKGKSRADMADVYEGWGDVRGQSPMSPTRPPSMRKRQSMQLLDLETRLDQIVSENRLLASQKLTAEKAVQEQARDHSRERHAYETAMQEHRDYLTQKDSELSKLRQVIEQLHDQAAHLTEVNEGLASSRGLDEEHEQSYNQLRAEHAHTHEQWQNSSKELEDLKEQHTQLSAGMEDIVRHEVTVALEEKNVELRQLQNELENAKQQVRNLQQQLLANRNSDDFVERDEDYFDSQCQSLCQHVQQWVLRFSKFSDMKACYPVREIQDEKLVDRMENAILDGSDADDYLSDRVKRRDVFMSVVMTMIWEFIFTRYLFGMDREQRQKLKILEKTLQEVGPISAVHKWRATTLTLLMKRETFENQRAADTEAVVHEIYDTLATFLPPPVHLVGQIQDSLRKVIDTAVDLSIEMRTQRAEYSMLPPLQPEYDTHGDLARKVYFSALTMNERSGATSSNEALQEQHAVVRMVLFPLVVKNEDDDEQIVVCPAQVLTAEGSKGKKTVRVLSAQGSEVQMEGGMI